MLLWLDDTRDPSKYGCSGWTWARTADEAIALLETGTVDAASLDHDLEGETGMRVLEHMEREGCWPRLGVFAHSGNSEGVAAMRKIIAPRYPHLAHLCDARMTPLERASAADWIVGRDSRE